MSHHPMHYFSHDGKFDVEREPVPFIRCDRCELWIDDGDQPIETEHGRVCPKCASLCDDCDKLHVAIYSGMRLCEDCESARGEEQDERSYAAFHGGTAAQHVYDATYARRR